MGLFDFLGKFREKRDQGKSTDQAIKAVKQAAQASNYNQASIQAFYALEEIGKAYASVEREVSTTAREYGKLLVEDGRTTQEELDPIIYNFEVAKYSPSEVTFDDYRNVESSLESLLVNYRKGSPQKTKRKKSSAKTKKRRRKPKRRATGARKKSE